MRAIFLISCLLVTTTCGCGGVTRTHTTLKVSELINADQGPRRLTESALQAGERHQPHLAHGQHVEGLRELAKRFMARCDRLAPAGAAGEQSTTLAGAGIARVE